MIHERNKEKLREEHFKCDSFFFYLFSFSNRCSACQLGTDTLIHWSGCVSGMQMYFHLNVHFSSSNHGVHPLTLQLSHLLGQYIFIYTHTVYMDPQIVSLSVLLSFLPLSFFHTHKCTIILKLVHQVMGV